MDSVQEAIVSIRGDWRHSPQISTKFKRETLNTVNSFAFILNVCVCKTENGAYESVCCFLNLVLVQGLMSLIASLGQGLLA